MLLIHEMLAKSSLDYPNKDAFVNKNKRFTFREIDEASTKVANFLMSNGINYGDRLGIYSSKNIEEIITIFAALKIGCIFVHINPHFKEEQLSHIISDCDIKVLFIHESKVKEFKKINLDRKQLNLIISLSPTISLEQQYNVQFIDRILNEAPSVEKIPIKINQNDPAAIIYTSGSMGKPKGIIVTHKILQDSTVISAAVLENNSDDRLISVTPFSFDGALSQLFTSTYVGGTLVLQESSFPKDVVDTMLNERITGFHAVPSFWKMLLQKHSPFGKNVYGDLRYVSIVGEVFPYDELMKLKKILNSTKFFMMYGITEAFRSTCLLPEDFDKKLPSIGKPLPGVEITIVDENHRLCDPGEIGEIVHRGGFVSPGYWNNSIRTSETFNNGVLYTGDLGKMDEEGYIYFVGRKDAMIKSMGYRISPEEIEECLNKGPEVVESAVTSFFDDTGCNKIKALIVSDKGAEITQKDIIDYCKLHLPYYMVPSLVEFQTEIPKTGTFKIKRSQLI